MCRFGTFSTAAEIKTLNVCITTLFERYFCTSNERLKLFILRK